MDSNMTTFKQEYTPFDAPLGAPPLAQAKPEPHSDLATTPHAIAPQGAFAPRGANPDDGPPLPFESPNPPVARVTAVDRDRYLIRGEAGEMPAELTGRLLHTHTEPSDLPCVGDWVEVQYHDAKSPASIHRIRPRHTFLHRKNPGKKHGHQIIAANIDVAFIVQSCHFDFNVRRLERYLVMVNEGNIAPIIVLTKADLIDTDTLTQQIDTIRRAGIKARIIPLSNVTGEGVAALRALILPGQTACLLGSSGVGKTTLTNLLAGQAGLPTGEVSHSGEGRHTTTRRQLIALEHGGFLIDMPGMRELGMLGVDDSIDESFSTIQAHSRRCRFANCTHTQEPGCAVQSAIAQDELDAAHLQNYQKLKKESEFHALTHPEKRKKDRAFGKFVRAAMKAKGDRY